MLDGDARRCWRLDTPFEGQTDRDGQKDTLRVAATFDGLIDLLDFSGLIKTFSITLQRIEPGHHKKWGADSRRSGQVSHKIFFTCLSLFKYRYKIHYSKYLEEG